MIVAWWPGVLAQLLDFDGEAPRRAQGGAVGEAEEASVTIERSAGRRCANVGPADDHRAILRE
jgi:hypothetical protein